MKAEYKFIPEEKMVTSSLRIIENGNPRYLRVRINDIDFPKDGIKRIVFTEASGKTNEVFIDQRTNDIIKVNNEVIRKKAKAKKVITNKEVFKRAAALGISFAIITGAYLYASSKDFDDLMRRTGTDPDKTNIEVELEEEQKVEETVEKQVRNIAVNAKEIEKLSNDFINLVEYRGLKSLKVEDAASFMYLMHAELIDQKEYESLIEKGLIPYDIKDLVEKAWNVPGDVGAYNVEMSKSIEHPPGSDLPISTLIIDPDLKTIVEKQDKQLREAKQIKSTSNINYLIEDYRGFINGQNKWEGIEFSELPVSIQTLLKSRADQYMLSLIEISGSAVNEENFIFDQDIEGLLKPVINHQEGMTNSVTNTKSGISL